MKASIVILALSATALMNGPVLLADSFLEKSASARVSKGLKIVGMDTAPRIIKKVTPVYPQVLRAEGVQGIVIVDILIDSTGRAVSTELVKTNVPELSAHTLAAAKEWTFEPARAKGLPIATRVRVPFEFIMPELVAMDAR